MISGAAFCPQPPLLVPEVASGAAAELAALRSACRGAIDRALSSARRVVVLGSGGRSAAFGPGTRGSLAGYGVKVEVQLGAGDDDAPADLPLALTLGAWLLQSARPEACGFSVGTDFADSDAGRALERLVAADDVALLVMGDGSARRSTSAPGYLDGRAAGFDEAVRNAIASGDAAALAGLDVGLGAELLAAGVPAWRAAGRLLQGRSYDASVLYDDDPYGVAYLVAAWTARD